MNSARKMRIAAWLAIGMLAAAAAQAQSGPVADQIAQHEQKLAAARAAGSSKEETTELNLLGMLYRQAGKMQKALECLNEVLPIEQSAGNRAGQAMTENTMGDRKSVV